MTTEQDYLVVETVCSMGRIMLRSGAEVYRVEQTISHVCKAYGIHSIQCTVNPSVITASYLSDGRPQTLMIRAKGQRLNLDKVAQMNSLSRSVVEKPMPLDELQKRVDEIAGQKPYGPLITALAAGTGTGAYAIISGGNILDFLCGFLIGALLRLLILLLSRYGFQDMFSRFLAGAFASLLGAFLVYIGLGSQWDLITISALTLLFPGLMFTNALRDIGTGDFASAVTHAVEAFSIAAALAGGAALTHGILMRMGVMLI